MENEIRLASISKHTLALGLLLVAFAILPLQYRTIVFMIGAAVSNLPKKAQEPKMPNQPITQ
jgi:hypothetical protein